MSQAITNDSFLNLLDELRDELEMISTTNALITITEGDDDIENAVTKSLEIVDVLATDLIAKHEHKNSGYTHVSQALPVNTENNDVLYVGINSQGYACVFNYLSRPLFGNKQAHICHYVTEHESECQMEDLVWWKILERPTKKQNMEHLDDNTSPNSNA